MLDGRNPALTSYLQGVYTFTKVLGADPRISPNDQNRMWISTVTVALGLPNDQTFCECWAWQRPKLPKKPLKNHLDVLKILMGLGSRVLCFFLRFHVGCPVGQKFVRING